MTAHAMQGDREKCLNAQMDDYITKPIDVDKFFALLEKWLMDKIEQLQLNETQDTMQNIETSANTAEQTTPVLPTLKAINIPKALVRMRGKQDLLLRLLHNFKAQKADMAQQISAALQAKDMSTAKALIHSLKGEAGTLETTALFVATQNLEQQVLQNSSEQQAYLLVVEHALLEVLKDIEILEQAIPQSAEPDNLPRDTEVNRAELTKNLQELKKLLQDNNLRAKKLAKTITPQLQVSAYAEHWDKLLQALAVLDFEIAQTYLQIVTEKLKI